jgi:hypothetical protein
MTQHAVINFRQDGRKQLGQPKAGMTYVTFSNDFSTAFVDHANGTSTTFPMPDTVTEV